MTDLLADALVDLGLRRGSGGLAQSSDGGLTGEIDLRGVVLVSPRALQQRFAALAKVSLLAGFPTSRSSASGLRQGLHGPPPSAIRALRIEPLSIVRPAATDTRAKA